MTLVRTGAGSLRTVADIRRDFLERGLTVAAWAKVNGFTPDQVYDVLRGKAAGRFGASHAIAVKLGLKTGVVEDGVQALTSRHPIRPD